MIFFNYVTEYDKGIHKRSIYVRCNNKYFDDISNNKDIYLLIIIDEKNHIIL